MAMKWYAVHTWSGQEAKARAALLEQVRLHGLGDRFGDVLIPTEQVREVVKGKPRSMTRKF